MFRYFIYVSYNGARYCGWQWQPNGISVQEVLTGALCTVLRTDTLEVVGAGRTDTGVHASEMVAHFAVNEEITDKMTLCKKLNRFLPNDIAVLKITAVKDEAHARFSALSRQYEYHIVREKNVFKKGLAMKIETPLDFEKMNDAAKILFEYQDFTSFSKLHTDTKTNNCKIAIAEWTQQKDELIFTIKANRFLRNMVRSIVGTLLEVGRGKISIADFRAVIESKNRCKAGASVSAEGLFLVKVEYPETIFL
jgi:tRNA pseudouridine38-40 synthase